MLSIPLYEVFHLQMTLTKKFSVALMFFVGTLSVLLQPTPSGFQLTCPQYYNCIHPPPQIAHCFRRHKQCHMGADERRLVVGLRDQCRDYMRMHAGSPLNPHPRVSHSHQDDTSEHPAKQQEPSRRWKSWHKRKYRHDRECQKWKRERGR